MPEITRNPRTHPADCRQCVRRSLVRHSYQAPSQVGHGRIYVLSMRFPPVEGKPDISGDWIEVDLMDALATREKLNELNPGARFSLKSWVI
jgi:hypothetical protein